MAPIMAPPDNKRPKAAVITGLVLCRFLASSTKFFDVMAKHRICPMAAIPRTI